ncbi:MAG TPA: aldose 1-epimerase family protein [Acidimicrobiales bacterium]|nr:aldose 1-epimerase family protein [Acidimicrobiales bacterium]
MPRLPSGEQYDLAAGPYRAAVTSVGATLRELSWAGRPVLSGFGPESRSTSGRGQVLAPWPNRVRDGRYRFGGADLQLALDEPEQGNAIHGLVRWLEWVIVEHHPDRVSLRHVIWPRDGYPFLVELAVTYALDAAGGITVRMEAVNGGTDACPFGAGFHPYLGAGHPVDETVLHVPAATSLVTDERSTPVGREVVAGTERDFRSPRSVGPVRLDTCYTDLSRDGQGRAEITVLGPGGPETTVWMDAAFGFAMVFSADTLPQSQRRRALAVEPMSCAPNAFQSGEGLVVLAPGERWAGTWGVTVRS